MLKTCGELSLAEVEADVERHMDDKAFGQALDTIRDAVDTVINNRRSVARVYASEKLDHLCVRVARAVQAELGLLSSNETTSRAGTVIVATELAAAGGHVEVIKDLVRAGNVAKPVHLVLTNNFNRIDKQEQHGYAASMHVPITITEGTTSAERLRSLIDFLQAYRPHTLILLVHNQDALGITAALLGLADETLYVHHGDHHLSLGVTCETFSHLDLSNHAFFYCRHTLGNPHNRYLPLTLAKRLERVHSSAFLVNGQAVTAAVGRPEKFDVAGYHYQYLDMVGMILAATGGRHIHIGNLSTEQLIRVHEGLHRHDIDANRFKHIPWVDSVSIALIEQSVDLYIASFPYGGGKSQIEAMAAGMPTVIHQNYRSRVLCGIDLGYPNVLTWRKESELIAILGNLTPPLLQQHSSWARQHFERYHAEARFTDAMTSPITIEACVNPLAHIHNDGLQAFLDEEADLIGAPLIVENAKLLKMLQEQIAQSAQLHTQLAQKNAQISRMGLKRNMLKALLAGRRLKP